MTPAGAIHVDFLPPEAHRLRGRLGLTVAPGRWRPGLDAASDTLVQDDLRRLRRFHRARMLVTLLEEFEMKRLGISNLLDEVRRAGLRSTWFPIPDGTAPRDLDATATLVRGILDAMTAGDTVVVHCHAGLGRTGTIAACCLVAAGKAPAQAVQLVRDARPGALETEDQVRFVGRFQAG